MTSADPASRTSSSTLARAGVRRRGRRTRAALLVPGVAAGLLLAGVVVADAATSTSTLAVCLKRGAPMVAPTASGSCPSGYTLTRVVGARGPAGATGATGARGPAGADGARGATGATGATGAAGQAGATGATGDAGPQGDVGPQGLMGPEGPEGAEGAQGDAGPQGDVGPHGDVGPQGLMGPAGPAGADGTGPVWLDTGEATVYTASDTHTLASVTLPAGTYVLTAHVFLNEAVPFDASATIECQFIVGGDDSLLTPQPPTVASPQITMLHDVIALPTGVVTSAGASSPMSLRCAATNEGGGFTLTGTLLATRVSEATVT